MTSPSPGFPGGSPETQVGSWLAAVGASSPHLVALLGNPEYENHGPFPGGEPRNSSWLASVGASNPHLVASYLWTGQIIPFTGPECPTIAAVGSSDPHLITAYKCPQDGLISMIPLRLRQRSSQQLPTGPRVPGINTYL